MSVAVDVTDRLRAVEKMSEATVFQRVMLCASLLERSGILLSCGIVAGTEGALFWSTSS